MILPRLTRPLAILLLAGSTLLSSPAIGADKTPDDAKEFIRTLAQQAITTVAQRDLPDDERGERFRRLFVASFDLPEISQFVLGHYWRAATPEQQQEFSRLFQEIQVLTWTERFKNYEGETLTVTDAVKSGDKDFIVLSQLTHPGSQPTAVQWRVHTIDDGELRVTDLVVESVSMAITQRSDFNSALQGANGKIDTLLTALRAKVEQMHAGS